MRLAAPCRRHRVLLFAALLALLPYVHSGDDPTLAIAASDQAGRHHCGSSPGNQEPPGDLTDAERIRRGYVVFGKRLQEPPAGMVISDDDLTTVELEPPPPMVLFTLVVNSDAGAHGGEQRVLGTVVVREGEEVADAVAAFVPDADVINDSAGSGGGNGDGSGGGGGTVAVTSAMRRRIVDHLCSLGPVESSHDGGRMLLCSRRRPRRKLAEFSVYDPATRGTPQGLPVFVSVHDADAAGGPEKLALLALRACDKLPTCRKQRRALLRQSLGVGAGNGGSGSNGSGGGGFPPVAAMERELRAEVERRLLRAIETEAASSCLYERLGLAPPTPPNGFPPGAVGAPSFGSLGGGPWVEPWTDAEVRKAFIGRSKVLHPDKPTGNTALFLSLQEAFATLGAEAERSAYDAAHGHGSHHPGNRHHRNDAAKQQGHDGDSVGFVNGNAVRHIHTMFPGATVTVDAFGNVQILLG